MAGTFSFLFFFQVYPTLYKPLVSNPFQGAAYMVQAIGTKSKGGPVLRTAASQAHANKAKAAGMKCMRPYYRVVLVA